MPDRYYHPGTLPDSPCMGCREGAKLDGDEHVQDCGDGLEYVFACTDAETIKKAKAWRLAQLGQETEADG